ncbi:lytic murein transglycosylase [Rhodobacter sp. Har01]|uniref:lytic murein transglycosylase n=1 Tax=Rhodobacter sp. Har01 TaxID=2883999 RepID=UPI001D0659AE|nr:lytic murein transglycosylase [Rhodobacter sp. Har01]MCB6178613.1 lytic murein transglycosylase [Rhodobacter sp. Har01]
MITRRTLGLTALGALLSGCIGGGSGGGARGAGGEAAPPRPVPNPAFDAWVAAYRDRAAGRGISRSTMDAAFRGAGFLPQVVEKDRNQTEFKRTLEDYLSIAASDERVAMGRQKFASLGGLLAQIEARYGVEAHVIAAFWGMESYFGTRRGNVPVISALATLAFDGRRAEFFESQLTAALKIIQNGDIAADRMTGSWAGAMGHTQFIPTAYLAYAADWTGDGRRDIWSEDPSDALASTANYVAKSGWQKGLPWGMEVTLPAGFPTGLLGRGKAKSADDWRMLGVRPASGERMASGSIVAPGGLGSPAFLLTRNFAVILRYNNAENYAIGVGHLSDRIRGGEAIRGNFGPDASGLTKADRQEIQRLLTAKGHDTGGSDGVMGAKTKAAIEAFEASRGLPMTGTATPALLALLRR